MSPRKRPAKKARMIKQEFDVDLTLLANRQLFLQEEIDEETSQRINKHLFALDTVSHKPIMIYIDSPGGSCSSGISIINAMKTIESPVVTIIIGEACSMAGQISIAGNKRSCYENSVWMVHDRATYMEDYFAKIKDRAKFLDEYDKLLEKHLREHTKLTDKEIKRSKNGELWLFSEDMINKGIVDEIILHSKK